MSITVNRLDSGELQLVMGIEFLPEDAWQIHELLDRAAAGARVELDFRRVRDCHDFALSLLARDILSGRVTFDLHGMSQHQERVLSYFGVPASGDLDALVDRDPI